MPGRRRRLLRWLGWGTAVLIGLVIVALVATQTPWFRDWLRRTAMRQAERVIDGQLVIGRIEGRLFDGITLRDVALVQNGTPVVTMDRVAVTYGLGELLSDGRVIAQLHVDRPIVRAVRTPDGWNLARLLKPRPPSEPGRPRATFALPDIAVTDGTVLVEGDGAEPAGAIPRRIEDLQFSGGVTSDPSHLAIDIRRLALRAEQPALDLQSVDGRLVSTTDGWTFEDIVVVTGASRVRVAGTLTRPDPAAALTYALDVDGERISLPEIGGFLPAVAYLEVAPSLQTSVRGTLDALELDLRMTSAAGDATGPVTLDLTGPTRAVAGSLRVRDVDLATWVGRPEAGGRITGDATFDLRFPSATPGVALDGSFAFRGPEASAYGYAATDVTARGRLRGRRIELDASAAAYGGRATTRGSIDRPGPSQPDVRLSLAGRVERIDLRTLWESLPVPNLDTSLSGAYTVDGPMSALRATATLDASTVEGATLLPGLTAAFTRSGRDYSFEADGEIEGLDVPRLGQALDVAAMQDERFAGGVTGAFAVEGTQRGDDSLRLVASGTLRDTNVLGGVIPSMRVEATLADRALDVVARGRIEGYDLPTVSGVAALTGTLTGEVDSRVTFTTFDEVAFDTVNVAGTVRLERPTLLDVPFEQVTADVRLQRGLLDVRAVEGTGEGFTLTGKGTLALGESGASTFSYRLDAASLVNPARIADLPLTGAAVTEGTITGSRDDFTATGTLTGTGVAYGTTISADTASASYTVRVPDFDPARLDVVSTVSATTLGVAGMPLAEATGEIAYVPGLLTFDASAADEVRTVHGEGSLALDDGKQVLTLRDLRVEREAVRWALAPGTDAALAITSSAIDVAPVTLVHGSQTIALEGRVALADTETHDASLVMTGVEIGDALLIADQDVDADGTVALDVEIGGTGATPAASGTLNVTGARYRDLPIASIEARVEDDGRIAQVEAIVRQSDLAYVTAKGTVPRTLFLPPEAAPETGEDRLDLAIQSTSIDLRLAEGLTDQVRDLTGQAQVDIRLTNTGRTPVVDGEVRFTNAGFLVAATGVAYGNVNGALDFEDDRVVVRHLTAESREGRTLDISGEVGLRNARKGDLSLSISGQGVRVLDNAFGQIDVDSTLAVTGNLSAPVVEGDLVIASGRLEVDAVLPRVATGTYATEATYQGIPTYRDEDAFPVVPNILQRAPGDGAPDEETADEPETPLFVYDDLALNIRVRIPDNLLLRGRDVEVGRNSIGDVNVTMGGDFRVAKAAGEPLVLIGAVNTVRGTYSYQGRRFEIARDGQVLFRGDGTTNPSLDITAERVIQGVEARVRIQGTAEDPTLTLSSDPPLDEADVLALIVFNQPVNQLGTGQQNSLAQRAGGVAAGFAVSPIAQALGNSLDLDLFDVETTDPSGRVNPAVVIGQQVNQNLFVKFRQQFGNQQVSQFLLEYRLADFLRLQGNAAEGDGLARGNRSLTQRIERYGADLVFYFAF